jgi:hypothetical protein
MACLKPELNNHPTEADLASFLEGSLRTEEKNRLEDHIAACGECLEKIVSAYEAVRSIDKRIPKKRGNGNFMKKINIYLLLAVISFSLSFITPRCFLQLLVATLLLGTKWIVDAKSTKMLVMIYEAWKKGDEKEASRIMEAMEPARKSRF